MDRREREEQMQPTGSGGGSELSRGGLARFRSAPATWLEALLESVEEDAAVIGPPKPASFTQLPPISTANTVAPTRRNAASYVDPGFDAAGGAGFLRQNSSPAELLAQISPSSDGYFSNFGGISGTYDYVSSSIDGSRSGKRARDVDSEDPSAKFASQLKGEESGQLHSRAGSLLEAEMEKLLEDSVPCRIRAKRGCATHPRSIAERVRRTRISDRIRKLQELVPNMDKQTNTADMLEEAVEYVKFLQRQIQELTEHQKKCTCLAKE